MSFDNLSSSTDAVASAVTFGSIADIARQNAAAADVLAGTEALEEVQERIAECNDNGGLSKESMAFAMLAIQHATRSLGVCDNLISFPATESFDEQGRATVDDRVLQLATEGLATTAGDIARRQYSATLRAWRFLGTQITFQRDSLDRIVKLAEKTKGTQDTTAIEVDFDRLHQDGKVPADPTAFLTDYYSQYSRIQKKWLQTAGAAWGANMKLVATLKRDTDRDFESSLAKIANEFADCRKLAGIDPNMVVPGGYRFFQDRKSTYSGDLAAAKKLDDLANKNYPRRMGDMRRIGELGKVEVKPLTAAQVQKLCKSAKNAMLPISVVDTFYESLSSMSTSFVAGPLWMVPFLKPVLMGVTAGHVGVKGLIHGITRSRATMGWGKDIRKKYRGELRALRDAMRTSNHLIWHFMFDTTSVTTGINSAMLAYCRRSLKTYK